MPRRRSRVTPDLERDDFSYDAAQENAVKHLQRLYDDLLRAPAPKPSVTASGESALSKVAGLFGKRKAAAPEAPAKPAVMGLYFGAAWGRQDLSGRCVLRGAAVRAQDAPTSIASCSVSTAS